MAKLRTNTRLWVYAFLLLLAIAMLLYLRRQVKTSKEAASLPFIERDYPEIRKEGTLRLLAGYGSGGEVQGGQLSGAIYELAKQLEKKSGLRVEVVLENRWDEALRHLSTGTADLVAHPITHTSAVDTTRYMLFAEKTSGPIYLVQRRADSAHHISRQVELAGHSITLPKASPPLALHRASRRRDRRQPKHPGRHTLRCRAARHAGRLGEDQLYRLHL